MAGRARGVGTVNFDRRLRQRRLRQLAAYLLVVGGVACHLWLSAQFIVIRPGPVAAAADLVRVEATSTPHHNLYVTAVVAQRANLFEAVRALWDPTRQLQRNTIDLSRGGQWSEYVGYLNELMHESQQVAATVALRHLGYRVPVRAEAEIASGSLEISLPVSIHFEPSEIAGASAGLILALEVYAQLAPGELSGPAVVAGTGEIRLDGSVQPVDGVRQKVQAAEAFGADLFLVPRQNLEEAVAASRAMPVVAVDSFSHALWYLKRWVVKDIERDKTNIVQS